MTDVKPKRRAYRSQKLAEQAAGTREIVLAAASKLFLSQGWGATTIAAIASAAGVSSETIYATFRSKRALLQELIVRAVRGPDPDTPLTEQETPRRIVGETDQGRQIELFSEDIAKLLARVAALMEVARVAAETDAAIGKLYAELHRGRRRNLEWFAGALLRNGPLRDARDEKSAGTILWRLASPDLFLMMRRVEGVSQRVYADWLATTLKLLMLKP